MTLDKLVEVIREQGFPDFAKSYVYCWTYRGHIPPAREPYGDEHVAAILERLRRNGGVSSKPRSTPLRE